MKRNKLIEIEEHSLRLLNHTFYGAYFDSFWRENGHSHEYLIGRYDDL